MSQNRLKMNDAKTEVIYFGSSKHLKSIGTRNVEIGNSSIEPSNKAKLLGAWFDSMLSFEYFVSIKCRTARVNLFKIRSIRKYIDQETCKSLVHALVISHIDYANGILSGLSKRLILKLQCIMNKAAKLILCRNKYDSATQAMFELHWMPVEFRIKYKLALLVYKALNNLAPSYLSEMLHFSTSIYSTRAETDRKLVVPRASRIGDRAFSVAGPRIWNELPTDIRNLTTLGSFKNRLKTHYFKLAYPDLCDRQHLG